VLCCPCILACGCGLVALPFYGCYLAAGGGSNNRSVHAEQAHNAALHQQMGMGRDANGNMVPMPMHHPQQGYQQQGYQQQGHVQMGHVQMGHVQMGQVQMGQVSRWSSCGPPRHADGSLPPNKPQQPMMAQAPQQQPMMVQGQVIAAPVQVQGQVVGRGGGGEPTLQVQAQVVQL
jgi:hypothetical protein